MSNSNRLLTFLQLKLLQPRLLQPRLLQPRLLQLPCLLLLLMLAKTVQAQEDLSQHWDGVWIAEGTLFTIEVAVSDGIMQVTKIETMGFEWTNEDGQVDGNIVRVAVAYAGVTGTVQAELVDANTAIAFASTCIPDFMVVCALAKGRQAVFRRVDSN